MYQEERRPRPASASQRSHPQRAVTSAHVAHPHCTQSLEFSKPSKPSKQKENTTYTSQYGRGTTRCSHLPKFPKLKCSSAGSLHHGRNWNWDLLTHLHLSWPYKYHGRAARNQTGASHTRLPFVAMTVVVPETVPTSKVYQTNQGPSDLLSRFIKQHQDLQSYKYVSVSGARPQLDLLWF
jgi:hypothetical protein